MKRCRARFLWLAACALAAVALAACGVEPAAPTASAAYTAVLPSPTREFRLIPSWTPTASPPPSATPTPRPSATPNLTLRPYLTAQPNYTPHSGQGIATPDPLNSLSWVERFSFAVDEQPILLFNLPYDPAAWQLETLLTPGGLGYQLAHRQIDGCLLSQTTGGNATAEMTVEYQDQTLGSTAYYIGQATLGEELAFVTYCTSYADTPTCFIAYPGTAERRCLAEVEGMLAGVTFLTNPRYTASPVLWACRDELGTAGLCQVSYTLPLHAFSLPSATDGWAVGEDGLIMRKEGDAWRRENSPATTALYAVTVLDAQHGWAAGLGGLILAWDGDAWTVQQASSAPLDQAQGGSSAIYALGFSAADDGWAAGGITSPDGQVAPLLLHWDGQRWLPVEALPACQGCALQAVLALSSSDAWVAGGSLEGGLLWHWDGAQWTPYTAPAAAWLYDLTQAADGTLWAVGISQAVTPEGGSARRGAALKFDGVEWIPLSLPPNDGGLYAVAELQPGVLVAAGEDSLFYAAHTWAYITAEIAAYGRISAVQHTPDGRLFALTSSGFLFELVTSP